MQISNINTVSLEQYNNDYMRPNTDLESKPPIRSRKQLKCMYPEWLDDISDVKLLTLKGNNTTHSIYVIYCIHLV